MTNVSEIETAPRKSPQGMSTSMRLAEACARYAADAQYQGLTLPEMAEACGVSERRLRRAFYESFAMSPTAYLRTAALREVRRVLLEGAATRDAVTRAASEYGFWHLGRFAAQYRDLFGEQPSATAARRETEDVLAG
jgi:AraC family ethanolamine operon transcriptional activator